MKQVAVFFADGFEEIEALTPVDYLRRAGVNVTMVGVKGQMLNNKMIVTGSHKIPVIVDISLDDYLATKPNPDCVICPGGLPGAEHLCNTNELLTLLEQLNSNNKIIAAICASPALVLGKTSILQNKKWTCYPTMQEETKPEYAKNYSNQVFITDGNLVTSRGPGASEQFAMELVRLLCGEEVANKVYTSSQQTH